MESMTRIYHLEKLFCKKNQDAEQTINKREAG